MKKQWWIAGLVVLALAIAAGAVYYVSSRPQPRQYQMRFVSYRATADGAQAATVQAVDDDPANPTWTKSVRCPLQGLQRGDIVLIQEVLGSPGPAEDISADTVLSKVE